MRAARVRGSVGSVTVTETGTRAREADERGYATTDDGLRLYWERYGSGSPTIVLLPPCPISHSRLWKAQVHYLARHHRVVVYDGRGNGNSDCPDVSGPWIDRWRASDCLAVMDGHVDRDRRARRDLRRRRPALDPDRGRASGARARHRRDRPGRPGAGATAPLARRRARALGTRCSTRRRAGRRRTATTCAPITGSSSSSSSARCSRSHTRPSRSRTPSPTGSTARSRRC